MAWFKRKSDDRSVEALLAESDSASPTGPAPTTPTPQPGAGADPGFRMTVEDVFMITGRGTVVTGRVDSGAVAVGQVVRQLRGDAVVRQVPVNGIEAFRAMKQTAQAGDNIGLLVGSLDRSAFLRGDVLSG